MIVAKTCLTHLSARPQAQLGLIFLDFLTQVNDRHTIEAVAAEQAAERKPRRWEGARQGPTRRRRVGSCKYL